MTELKQVIFGHDFGAITDIEVGPDGYLYIMSLDKEVLIAILSTRKYPAFNIIPRLKVSLYKIVPQEKMNEKSHRISHQMPQFL